jgi:hypothetical protein
MFRTFDPYYDYDQKISNEQIEKEQDECFICYEIKLDNKIEPIRLKMQILYLKNCECDGAIHGKCLDIWYNLNKTCPICRKVIVKNDCKLIKFMNRYKIFISSYIFYKKYIYKIKKILFVILATCLIMDFYFQIVHSKYYNKYNNDDLYHYNNFERNPNPTINFIFPFNSSSKMNPNYHN